MIVCLYLELSRLLIGSQLTFFMMQTHSVPLRCPVLASAPDPVRVVVSVAASIASSVAGSNFEKN